MVLTTSAERAFDARSARARRHVLVAGLSLAALGAACPALAGERAEVRAAEVASAVESEAAVTDELVVTAARRRDENVQDVPIAITTLSGAFIAKSDHIRLAQDVVAYAPNVTAAATDGRDRPRWFIRGVGTNNTDANGVSPVGIYRDEVYLANFYAQAFPLFDQERVEILSGPQGTLWGKNTTGGAISYVSKAPSFETGGYARALTGSFGEWGVDGAITGAFVPGLLAGRLSFYHGADDGWQRNLYVADVTPPNATAWNRNDAKRVGADDDTALRAQLLFTPRDDLNVLLSYHHRRYKGDQTPSYILPDLYIAAVNNPTFNQGYTSPGNPLPYGYSWAADTGRETIDNNGGLLRVNWKVGGLQLTALTGYEANKLVRWADGSTAIPLRNNVSRQRTPDRQFSQELRLASPAEDRFNWIVGAYYFNEDNTSEAWAGNLNVYTAPVAGRSYSDNYTHTDTESFAAFGSATYAFTDRFKLTAGGRATTEKKTFSQSFTLGTGAVAFNNPDEWWRETSVSSPLVTNSVASIDRTYKSFTWDVIPQYQLADHALAYFHYSYGYLSGGFDNRRNTAVTPNIVQIFEYQPERIHTYELGLKTSWWNGRLTANAAAFYYDYPSIQVLVILPSTGTNTNSTATVGSGYSNAAGTVKGLEFTVDAHPIEPLRLRAALGLLDTNYTDYPIQTGINYPRLGLVNATIDPSGNTFTRAPNVTFSTQGSYTFDLGEVGAFELNAEYRYLGLQYFNPTLEFDHTLEQGGYGLVNLGAALDFGGQRQHRLSVSVQNAFDKQYLIHAIAPTNSGSSARQGAPRSYVVSLSTTF